MKKLLLVVVLALGLGSCSDSTDEAAAEAKNDIEGVYDIKKVEFADENMVVNEGSTNLKGVDYITATITISKESVVWHEDGKDTDVMKVLKIDNETVTTEDGVTKKYGTRKLLVEGYDVDVDVNGNEIGEKRKLFLIMTY
jgi:hypothetical protein